MFNFFLYNRSHEKKKVKAIQFVEYYFLKANSSFLFHYPLLCGLLGSITKHSMEGADQFCTYVFMECKCEICCAYGMVRWLGRFTFGW